VSEWRKKYLNYARMKEFLGLAERRLQRDEATIVDVHTSNEGWVARMMARRNLSYKPIAATDGEELEKILAAASEVDPMETPKPTLSARPGRPSLARSSTLESAQPQIKTAKESPLKQSVGIDNQEESDHEEWLHKATPGKNEKLDTNQNLRQSAAKLVESDSDGEGHSDAEAEGVQATEQTPLIPSASPALSKSGKVVNSKPQAFQHLQHLEHEASKSSGLSKRSSFVHNMPVLHRQNSIGGALRRMSAIVKPSETVQKFKKFDYTGAPLEGVLAIRNLDEEYVFFEELDAQRQKVEDFYIEREDEAKNKFQMIISQLEQLQLAVQKDTTIAGQMAAQSNAKFMEQLKSKSLLSEFASSILTKRDKLSAMEQGAGAEAKITEEGSLVNALLQKQMNAGEAKSKIELALQEFYRYLTLVSNYQILNKMGFQKILKKYTKNMGWNAKMRYTQEKLDHKRFYSSTRVDELIKATEKLWMNLHGDENRRDALAKLRIPDIKHSVSPNTAWRTALWLGLAIWPLIAAIRNSMSFSKN
jgi:hypothetical protein